MASVMGDAVLAPPRPQQRDSEGLTDHRLVAAVRRGDERAFEELYNRYNRRIQAYVCGMCKDHARAEDITQEIFVSALRRMRETERPIAFKPWIYEIAKNACIDQHRRTRRVEEVSLQAEDGLAPADYGRLINAGPTPDVAVAAKQDLDDLCGAFGGLSETHHEILVMRELEGLSYREIGERLGMSRPAVESTLFRARRRLTEEYDELVSGERCLRIQGIIATAGRGRLGTRDARRLSRHVAYCQACRREAMAAGLDSAVLRKPLRSRAAAKVAALLPFPMLGRRFGRGADEAAASAASHGWVSQLPMISDQLGAGWAKAAAAVVLLLAGVGAGVGTRAATDSGTPAAPGSAAHNGAGAPAGGRGAAESGALVVPASAEAGASDRPLKVRARSGRAGAGAKKTAKGARAANGAAATTHTGAGADGQDGRAGGAAGDAASGTTKAAPRVEVPKAPSAPKLVVPATTPVDPADTIEDAPPPVAPVVNGAVGAVTGTVDETTGAAGSATAPVTGAAGDTLDALAP